MGLTPLATNNYSGMSDWPPYNESLVRRGQVLLDFDVLDRWDQELFQMNLGKIGEPYCYPDVPQMVNAFFLSS